MVRASPFVSVLEALAGGDIAALHALGLAPEGQAWQRTDSFHPALFSLERLTAPTAEVFALFINMLEEPRFGRLEQRALTRVLGAVNPAASPDIIPALVQLAVGFRDREDARRALDRITEPNPRVIEVLCRELSAVLDSAVEVSQDSPTNASEFAAESRGQELAVVLEVLWRLRGDAGAQDGIRSALTVGETQVRAMVLRAVPGLAWADEELLASLLRTVGACDPITPRDALRSVREAVHDLLDTELPGALPDVRVAVMDVLALLAIGRSDLYLLLLERLRHNSAAWLHRALRPALRTVRFDVDEATVGGDMPEPAGLRARLKAALAAIATERTGDMAKDMSISSGLDIVRERLAGVPDDAIIPTLRTFLPVVKDELHWQAPYAAARLLGKISGGHPEVIETLHACLSSVSSFDARSEVTEAAVRALRDLGETSERTLRLITGIALFAGTGTVRVIQAWLRELGPDFPGLLDLIGRRVGDALDDEFDPKRSYFSVAALYLLDVLQHFAVPHPGLANLLADWLPRGANVRTTAPRRVAETLGMLAFARPDDSPETRQAREAIRHDLQRRLAVADVGVAGLYQLALRVADTGVTQEA